MKTLFVTLVTAMILSSCGRPSKDLATVEIGMTKTEVTSIVGAPLKKNVVNETEIWDYPDSNRSVVFRKDTVYAIMTSARARVDSMEAWVDTTGTKIKKGLGKIGDKLEKAGDKIHDKVDGDSTLGE